jgi:hypothetical protein
MGLNEVMTGLLRLLLLRLILDRVLPKQPLQLLLMAKNGT